MLSIRTIEISTFCFLVLLAVAAEAGEGNESSSTDGSTPTPLNDQKNPELESLGAPAGTQEGAPTTKDELDSSERLSDRAELDRIIELYMAGRYERCSAELLVFLERSNPRAFQERTVVERGRLYLASCSLLEGKRTQARSALHAALEQNPLMRSPDSLTFPPPVVSLFLEVRDEVQLLIAAREKEQVIRLRRENEEVKRRAEQREYREKELEKLAQEEIVVARNSRWIASVPFGAGQFQNGDRALGYTLAVSQGLLLATAVTSGIILRSLTTQTSPDSSGAANTPVSFERINAQRDAAYSAMAWSSWGLLGLAVLGIGEAHLNFEQERFYEKRKRDLPEDLRDPDSNEEVGRGNWSPQFSIGPRGGSLGLIGSF